MTEFRIVTKIDPSGVVQGRAAVKQQLKGMEADAAQSGAAIEKFVVGGVTGSKALASAQVDLMRRMSDNAAATRKLGDASVTTAKGKRDLEAATRRVLSAVDQESAGQLKLNALLRDAKVAHDAGALSTANYAKMQAMAAQGSKALATGLGAQRAGFTQLSFQIGDIAQGMAMGTRASTIFAQQSGQVIQAFQVMGSGGTGFIRFLSGPWGIALSTAAVVLGPFIGKLFEGNSALEQAVEKLKKDAAETETDRKAKELYQHTEEGLTAAVRDRIAAMDESIKKSRTQGEQDNILAQSTMKATLATREQTKALLEQAIAQERSATIRSSAIGPRGEIAALGLPGAGAKVGALQDLLAANEKSMTDAESLFQRSLVELATEAAKTAADPVEKIRQKYEGPHGIIANIQSAANADRDLTTNRAKQLELTRQLTEEYRKEAAEIKEAQKNQRDLTDGVARFKSREQAIGIAGKELLGAGLNVSENVQFGGVHAEHPGMGNVAHGKYAIDVNVGQGIVEANIPDLKTKFDALARAYQQRGFKVIWAGQLYPPFGNGPSGPAKGHYNHFHVEAPQIIVGKPTQSAFAEAQLQDAKQAATVAEQQADFVQQAIDQAAGRGGTTTVVESTQTKLASIFADYKRRFNIEIPKDKRAAITGALTDAEARETADRFDQAYVKPLERLQALQGKTGLDRQVLNAQLAESERLGRQLYPIEAQRIENSIRQSDALQRENQILEDVRRPLDEYRKQIAALTADLQRGAISQDEFNRRVASLDLRKAIDQQGRTLGNADPAMQEIRDRQAETARQLDQERELTQQAYDVGIIQYQEYQSRLTEIARREGQNRVDTQIAVAQLQIGYGQQIADSLLSIAENSVGKQSAIYRTLFAVSKAFTIAQAALALYQNVAKAMAIGFPQNLPFIAAAFAQGATIVAAINSVASPGFQRGGYTGDGATDRPAGVVHGREFVVNAEATVRHRALLEAINSGRMLSQTRASGANDNRSMGGSPISVKLINLAPGVEHEVRKGPTEGDIEIIAKRVVRDEAPGVVARDLSQPASRTSKAVERNFRTSRKRA